MSGITRDRGRWYFVKRVPVRFREIDRRVTVRIALRTDSAEEARAKAGDIERRLWAYWEALAAGDQSAASRRYESALRIAETRGYAYRPVEELEVREIVQRVEAWRSAERLPPVVEVEALFGLAPPPELPITREMDEFLSLTRDRVAGKSEHQVRRYEATRRRTAADLAVALGADKSLASLTQEDAAAFRQWWVDRVVAGLNANTANKQIGHLSDLVKTLGKLRGVTYANPFAGMRLREGNGSSRSPFSVPWITTRLAAPGALAGLNDEARDVLLVMVNTGARPGEIINAQLADWRVGHAIPHLRIIARAGQQLKTDGSGREIPLLGVSLEAAQRIAGRGGCPRYGGDSSRWSATVGKYLVENGLREEPGCTPYSLRHSFEDRLLDAGVDDRIRADLMGHKYARPKYGPGGRLVRVQAEIARIAI